MGIRRSGDEFLWLECVVPFEIDSGDFPVGSENRQFIDRAISHWNSRTPIQLVKHNGQTDFVTFRAAASSCGSPVGRQGGSQDITCAVGDGFDAGSVIHEIGHAMGLWHEHSREDRNEFVTINFANIEPDKEHNFDQHIADGDDLFQYAYGSIMHYPRKAFTKNEHDTIIPVDSSAGIGQNGGLSHADIESVQFIYGTILTPRQISFGLVAVKDISTRTFRIENPTANSISVSFPVKLDGPFLFAPQPFVIPANTVKKEVVEFAPLGEGFRQGKIVIETDGGCCPRVILVSGTGTKEFEPL